MCRYFLARARRMLNGCNGNIPNTLQWLLTPQGYRFFVSHQWSYKLKRESMFSELSDPTDPIAYVTQVKKILSKLQPKN